MTDYHSVIIGTDNNTATDATYNKINATSSSSWSSNISLREIPVSGPCTLSNLNMALDVAPGAGTSYTFTVVKNGIATALAVTIADANTSAANSSDTVSCVAGDKIVLQANVSGAAASYGWQWWNLKVTTTDKSSMVLTSAIGPNTGATNWSSIGGGTASAVNFNTTEPPSQVIVPCVGTLSNLYCLISTAPGAAKSWTFTLVKNGVDTGLTCQISGAAAVTANDTVNTVAVVAGDTLSLKIVPAGTPSAVGMVSFSMLFTATNAGESWTGFGNGALPSTTASQFETPMGSGASSWSATEANREFMPGPLTMKALYVKLGTAPGGTATRRFGIDETGVETGLEVSMTGATASGNASLDKTTTQLTRYSLYSKVAGGPAAATDGVHAGLLLYMTPTGGENPTEVLVPQVASV